MSAAGAIAGGAAAIGVVLIALGLIRRSEVADRVLPLVRAADSGWDLAVRPPSAFSASATAVSWATGMLDRVWSASATRQRLIQAGRDGNVEAFRLQQLRWACSGLGLMLGLGVLRALSGKPLAPGAWLLMCGIAAMCGAIAADMALARAARQRSARIAAQLPVFAELLAFAVAAGLAPAAAMNRVAHRLDGDLADEMRECCSQIANGRPFADALEAVADRTCAPSVQRFADGLVVSVERGTPIADVLRAQAMDARDAGHRALMEATGKREIYALIPVVFLILPVVVLVAVYPGIYGITVTAG